MDRTSRKIESFLAFLRESEQQYHMAEADEQEANDATQDLLHSIELEEHDHDGFAQLSEDLKLIRQQRRKAKDTMSETAPVLDWIDANRSVIKGLERLLGDVRKAEKNTEGRIYTPKVRKKREEII